MKGNCIDCRFWMQAKNSCVCGHKKANMKEGGNGRYVYHNWTCDIDKFEKRTLSFDAEKKKCAKENGWKFLYRKNEIDFFER